MSKTFGKRAEDIKWQDDIRDLCLHIDSRIDDDTIISEKDMDKIFDILWEELEGLFPGLDYRNYN